MKIISFTVAENNQIVALAEDGTIWRSDIWTGHWVSLGSPPRRCPYDTDNDGNCPRHHNGCPK